MDRYEKLMATCEALLRAGRDHQVAKLLAKVNTASVPRKWRLPFASLCRRAAHVSMGLRILTPVVRGKKSAATVREQAEYAILLQRCGAIQEALVILRGLDFESAPEKALYQALCHFSYWEFERALPHLEQYVASDLTADELLTAEVNLARAHVAIGDFRKAEPILHGLIERARSSEASRIQGNCLELLSQAYLLTDRLDEADRALTEAEGIFAAGKSFERLLLAKGRAFLEAQKSGSTEPLLKFREQALAWPHAQTVRETDLFTLMIDFDESKFEHLYFGTPYKMYRRRVERLLGWNTERSSYLYGDSNSLVTLDVASGEASNGKKLPKGSVIHRVVEVLARDFYRPVKVGDLHNSLFPGEFFNIFSSPVRVRQAIFRAREWMKENRLPLHISGAKGNYSLSPREGMSLEVPLYRRPVGLNSGLMTDLKDHWPEGSSFTAKEAREKLKVSASAFQRFLAWGVANQRLEKFGAGSSTVYFVLTPPNRRRAG